jgi:hypothetical protein
MKRLFLMFCLVHSLPCVPPGLKVPLWHQGTISVPSVPEWKQNFTVQFDLSSAFTGLSNLKIRMDIPAGLTLVEGEQLVSIDEMNSSTTIQLSWEVRAEREIDGLPIRVTLELDTPEKELEKEARELYSQEPSHQMEQLARFIRTFRSRSQSYYSKPLFIYETEGTLEAKPLLFRKKVLFDGHDSPFLMYALNPLNQKEEQKALKMTRQFESFYEKLRVDPEARLLFEKNNPGGFRRMIEDHSYQTYQIAISRFQRKEFKSCDQILQKLTATLMTEAEFSYDFFLTIQNLRALTWIGRKKNESARSALITSVRTAPQSSVRHYLEYNLAVLYKIENNPAKMNHHLIESLKINPGFTLAKELQR